MKRIIFAALAAMAIAASGAAHADPVCYPQVFGQVCQDGPNYTVNGVPWPWGTAATPTTPPPASPQP